VIISGYYDAAAWTAWCWAGLHRKRRVLWAESNLFDHRRLSCKEALKRFFVTRCDCAHVYGTSNREYIEQLGMAPEKIFIKRAVADTALFIGAQGTTVRKGDRKTILYCGRFSPEKNLPLLLRAFAGLRRRVPEPQTVLKLVGYGPDEARLRGMASELGIVGAVEFAGRARQAELPAIMRAADALILPSTREPWGLVVNEAMLCGLPVAVSNRCGCCADLVQPSTGWTFSPFDEEELVRVLETIASAPREALAAMGEAARRVGEQYSPQNCALIVTQTLGALCIAR
jgi:glycosyltransferase involved in cell wall biosynthesis